MVGFAAYFQKGIEASKSAEANFLSIRDMFNRLNEELNVASGGILDFFLLDNINPDPNSMVRSFMPHWGRSRIYDSCSIPETEKDLVDSGLAVTPHGAELNKPTIICYINFTLDGLPCVVKRQGTTYHCETIDELENTIGEILAEPEVGRIIYVMMKKNDRDSDSSSD